MKHIKGLVRWCLFQIGPVTERRYSGAVPGYTGTAKVFGVLVAFIQDDGTPQFVW